ncbi:MAG TPA: 8-oxoguanine deaminase [Jatrophihabitans sp.]|jgi:cytosine/adenosine deaminase-related metal-dependent hydrolase|uniref:8-oxoguanine deaminase n=1 Tax=Jatrophihabitans sp. TaxID=1932789 RepID=UPI002EE4C1FC
MIVLEGGHVATVDAAGTEHPSGHVVLDGATIVAVGPGPAPAELRAGAQLLDTTGCLVTPGLVNTHHHLYQWLTRGFGTDSTLFGWLTELYPLWARIDADAVHAAASANLGWLALSGCSTSTDHHYVFPKSGGDLLEATISAALEIGVRFHPCRGSMDLGESAGGLPPDSVVEDRESILIATEAAIDRWHDESPAAMTRIAVAPCSPFSVTAELMREAAELARSKGVRLHTHLAETADEEQFCQQTYGRSPAEYLAELDWLGPDVWLAHCVHLSDPAIASLAETRTAVAHCPTSNGRLGAGSARVRDLIDAGVAVGLGVDGSASNEAGRLVDELRAAMVTARSHGGPQALTARETLRLATVGGAACLGRESELGSLEPGKLADVAVWRLDGLGLAGGADPVFCWAFSSSAPLELLLVNGQGVVADATLLTADSGRLAREAAAASARLVAR